MAGNAISRVGGGSKLRRGSQNKLESDCYRRTGNRLWAVDSLDIVGGELYIALTEVSLAEIM